MGRLGGPCPSWKSRLMTVPGEPLQSPTSCHKLQVSITLAPSARNTTGSSPPASSDVAEACC